MEDVFSKTERDLLVEVLGASASARHDLLSAIESDALSREQRDAICEIIGAELAETGLDGDSEPTKRGVALEELLDVVNRPNLK